MKKARKILSTLLVYCIVIGVLPTFALAIGQDYVWLDELQIVDSDRYTGNMGDSFIDKIGTRNGTIDTEGNRYSHGLEAWIARWNYKNESSWAWCTYDLNGKYDTLSGTIGILTESYNKTNFDTTLEIWGDNNLLYSLALHPNMTNQEITVNVAGVDTLKINLYDNKSVSGGTSFSLGDFRLYMDDAGKLIEESGDKNNDGAETGKFSFQGHTYQVFDDPLTWEDAKISCEAKGGYLATITTQEEQDFVNGLLSTSSAFFYWLGGTDERTEGSWEWVTGEPWSYENWRSGQPDNHSDLSDRQEDYLTIQPGIDRWNDLQNDGDPSGDCVLENGGYICEWSSEELVSYDVDSEGRVIFQGHTYQVIDESLTWEDAVQACTQRGGHLATITSEQEQGAVAYAINSGTKEAYWLGGSDETVEGQWQWITGENWSYDNWASGNPDNYQSENYLGILRTNQNWANNSGAAYTWNDFSNKDAVMMGYVCETEANEEGNFTDVSNADYFAPYVSWAVKNGITTGTSANTFSPYTTCTVAQIVTFLWRAEGAPTQQIVNPFGDVSEQDYFYQPALWAYQNGLVSGNRFAGDRPCTRAMTVMYLWILAGKPSAGGSPFSDVPNNADYAQAVAWAVNQGVTTGTSATTFSPNQTCTRAQIVTFLYRYISLDSPDSETNPGIPENPEIFNQETSFWGDEYYVYNGTELRQNRTYYSVGDTVIGNMTIPAGTKVRVSGDLEITGHISLSSSAELSCDGNLTVSSDGIIDLFSGGTISCDESFTFDSKTDHKQYLTAGLIEVGDDFESKRNFYASGSNEVHILGYRVHTINMWDKWVDDDQYFNIFRVVDYGIEILDVEEPFRCNAENGFLMDDWSWLKMDYYGNDFQFVGVPSPPESLKGVLQTGLMLAIASEGNVVEVGGIEFISVDTDEFIFSVYSPQQKRVITYTLEDISVTGLGLTTGKVATGQFKYNGRLYGFAPSPELSTKIWEDFKDTATILAITEVGDVYFDAYKNIVKSLISDVLPDSLQDAFQMTSMMEENSEIFENYQALAQIND
ncbi:lectin-like protein [Intestinimonas butyriciproducens]|uniref:lectin-like protein n=1 Tax=Intestinimonas butyriciproducens TaxID=1297617 RepID=UPI00195DCAE4|nr:lectin-like protein [Intestinimonas butyriciproducens]MBM6977345.1 S-layer homology domain-containing protein [Intestinimonas butyriciproducens]